MLPRLRTTARALAALVVALAGLAGLAVTAPVAPAGAVGGLPIQLVSRIGATAVSEPTVRWLNRTAPQSVSADGRYVAFATDSGPSNDDNGVGDVFVRDTWTGTTELISVGLDGRTGPYRSDSPSISGDGRYVAFVSSSPGLVADDGPSSLDVFVRDRVRGATTRVNVAPDGGRSGRDPFAAQISANGRTVAWLAFDGIFAAPTTGTAIPWTVDYGPSRDFAVSGNGRFVVTGVEGSERAIVRFDLVTGEARTVSLTPRGDPRAGYEPRVDHSGQVVSFVSYATDLVSPPVGGAIGEIYRATLTSGGVTIARVAPGLQSMGHTLSNDGTTVAVVTRDARDDDSDTAPDAYVIRGTGAPRLVSGSHPIAEPVLGRSVFFPEISGDGMTVAIVSSATGGTGTGTLAPRTFLVSTRTITEGMAPVTTWFPRLFGRSPTTTEVDARRRQVTALTRTGPAVVVDDLRRESFSGPRAGVVRLYLAYFHRAPEVDGYDYWVGRRRSGTSLDTISQSFAGSAEFRTLYGSLSDRAFVERVYANVLGRPADAAGAAYWTDQLARRALTRGQVMTRFSEAPENRAGTQMVVEMVMLTRQATGRMPSAAALDHVRAWRDGGLGSTTIVIAASGL